MDGTLDDVGQWSCKRVMQGRGESIIALSYSRWTYGIQDKLNNVISGRPEKFGRTSSLFRMLWLA